MKNYSITVGIITYERSEPLSRCLTSLWNQSKKPDEIIVVDSSKSNKTEETINEKFPDIVYLKTERRRMPQPNARNIVLKKASGDIIAFLDDDVVCAKNWCLNILEGYKYGDDVVGTTGPVIMCDENLNVLVKINRTAKNQNFFTKTGDIRCGSWKWIPPTPVKCQIMPGGNMSFKKEKLIELGGFDEFYGKYPGAYREETDPQIALVKKGFNFMYMPGALVYHIQTRKGGISEFESRSEYFYYCGKAHRYLSDKYFSKKWSRIGWVFWSISPPCLWLSVLLSIIRRRNYLKWHEGLWCGP
jgi:glycosyltransferase involved in cell wall biosynthesis